MKKSKAKIFIIIFFIILIIAIASGTAYYFYVENLDKNNPEDVLKEYFSYVENKNYEAMYSLLANANNEETTLNSESNSSENNTENNNSLGVNKEKFLTRNKNIYEGIESCNIVLSNIETNKNDNGTATVNYKLSMNTMAGKIEFYNTTTFNRKEDKKYYIVWDDSMIFPRLKSNYKVRVSFSSAQRGKILDRNGKVLAGQNDQAKRVYPYKEITSHLVGYVQVISKEELEKYADKGYTESSLIGKTGLEKIWEDRLREKNGCEIYIEDENGVKKQTLAKVSKQDGENIYTTIDISLQEKIYNQLKGENSLSVAIEPKTGEVLAMVSLPAYDSNDFISGFSNEKWNEISNDENNPFLNRVQATYVPGSSFKPIIAGIGLTTGKMNANEDYGASGLSWQKDESWGSYKVTTLKEYSGPANLRNALVYSDNIYFAKSSLKIGAEVLKEQFTKLGFNSEIPFELSMNKSQFTSDNEFSSEVQIADTGYGQGQVLVNPLHVAAMYSAFVNDGNMIKPYLEYTENAKKEYWIKEAFSKEAVKEIKNDLVQAVEDEEGTAHGAKIDGITIAGKTGTAELKSSQTETGGKELGWFNAFKVSENSNSQLLIITMIENVGDRGGSHYLLPKVREMFK